MSTTPFFFHSKIVSSDHELSFPQQLGDQHHTQISSFSPSPPSFLFDTQHHHKALDGSAALLHEDEMKLLGSTRCNGYDGIHQPASSDRPVKWMSSKMRIMRKMINSYQTPSTKPRRCNNHHLQYQKIKANLDGVIRVCSDCSTTKTPLWRSGPCGPKSLCNACGIRQRKARRAMAASAVKDNGPSEVDRTVPFKKRCRFAAAAAAAACVDGSSASSTGDERKLCFEDIVIRLSKSSAFHRVFPQDEKDAAILLMALSSGLLCSS